ncbi:hypothetical protein BDF22DRAFT_735385 [Syncephalis plumigaleata]|nr:hypothetical protein BDF22DRAFT_735385 [Syncephalis plumigaleata]
MSRKAKSKKSTSKPSATESTANTNAAAAAAPVDSPAQGEEQEVEQKGHGAQATKDMGDMLNILNEMQSGELEFSTVEKALKEIRQTEIERKAARAQSQVEVNKIALDDNAVQFVMNEFELTRIVAEQKLRLHDGDLTRTLTALVSNN